jgi:hypothetical protein
MVRLKGIGEPPNPFQNVTLKRAEIGRCMTLNATYEADYQRAGQMTVPDALSECPTSLELSDLVLHCGVTEDLSTGIPVYLTAPRRTWAHVLQRHLGDHARDVVARKTRRLLYSAFDCFGLGFSATCFDGDLHSTFHRIF